MTLLAFAIAWYAAVAVGGAAALGVLRRLGVGTSAAGAVSRVVGWTVAAYFAWLGAFLGVTQWWWLGAIPLAGMAVWGIRTWRGIDARALLGPEIIGAAAFVLLAFLRLPLFPIQGTEKPMDLAILATLLRPGTMPPNDPWLAGSSLPYYYWGFMPWTLPAKLLGLAPDVVFNLLVPTIAAVSAQAAWALARALGGSRRTGAMAAFLVVFAGTPDGWRQLLTGSGLGGSDLWHSSRQITGTITEFPLFTFHLGDLHPHLLCIPFVLVALFLARGMAGSASSHTRVPLLAVGLLFGAAAAANPWCALPLGAGVLLVAVAQEERLVWPVEWGLFLWLRVVAVGVLGWLLFIGFWLRFSPPFSGMGWVHSPTRWDELFLFMGGMLLAPMLVAWELAPRWGGFDAARRQMIRAAWLAGMTLVAVASKSVGLAIALGAGIVLGVGVVRGKTRRARPAWALTLLPLALLAVMETIYMKDPYGEEYYRMNTVFKASHLAFTLLAVLTPVLLGWVRRRRTVLAMVAAAAVLAVGLPQLLTLTIRATAAPIHGWGGLSWMAPGEAKAVDFLRTLPRGATLIEGIGDAYSDAARMSAASGVPAVLGWENHQLVWRGNQIMDETGRRKELIKTLYTCGDEQRVRTIAKELKAEYVVVGSIERSKYGEGGLPAVIRAGKKVFAADACTIVQVPWRE